jgi:hypothetical protein
VGGGWGVRSNINFTLLICAYVAKIVNIIIFITLQAAWEVPCRNSKLGNLKQRRRTPVTAGQVTNRTLWINVIVCNRIRTREQEIIVFISFVFQTNIHHRARQKFANEPSISLLM